MGTNQVSKRGGERGPVFVEALGFGASDGPGRATRTFQTMLKSALFRLTADDVKSGLMPLTIKREPTIAAPGKHTKDPDPKYFGQVAKRVEKILLNDDGTVKTAGKDNVDTIAASIQDSSLLLNGRFSKANQIHDHGDIFRSAFKTAVEAVDVVRLLICIEQVRVLDLHSGGPGGCSPPWYCEFYNAQGYDAPPPECVDMAREEPDIIEVGDDEDESAASVAGLQREIDSLRALLAEEEKDKMSAKRAAKEMSDTHALEIDELEEERDNLLDELVEARNAAKDGAAKIAELEDRIDNVTEERAAALASSKAKDDIIYELTTRVATLESEAAQLRAAAAAATAATAVAPSENEEGGEEEVADPDPDPDAGAALAAVQLGDQSEQDEQQHDDEEDGDGQEVDADADATVVADPGTNRRWMRSQGVIDLTE